MAEALDDKKVYFTRFRKNSMNSVQKAKEEEAIDLTEEPENKDKTDNGEGDPVNELECAICLQVCIHPARLPCGHIFCFLCVKGAAHGNKKCAMCRNPIPHNYFNNPDLVTTPDEIVDRHQEGYEWFYEGRHGWWQYDPRTTTDIEKSWVVGHSDCELLIAGNLYIINFKDMYQVRKCQPSRRRKIKRDLAASEKLGVAGLRDPNAPERRHSEGDKLRHEEFGYSSPEPDRRASFDSSAYLSSHDSELPLEWVFDSLSLNDDEEEEEEEDDDDDDSYQ